MSEELIGLDTSVVMRILTGEPEAQAKAAQEFVRTVILQGRRLVVSDLVVSEASFALVTHYGVPNRKPWKDCWRCSGAALSIPHTRGARSMFFVL
jgi:predicted nucleic acid-binding protein